MEAESSLRGAPGAVEGVSSQPHNFVGKPTDARTDLFEGRKPNKIDNERPSSELTASATRDQT